MQETDTIGDSTYSLQLLMGHGPNGLGDGVKLEGVSALQDTGARTRNAVADVLALLESRVLGVSNSLGEVLLADVALGNALDGLDGLGDRVANGLSRAGDVDSQKTSVGVGSVVSRDVDARGSRRGLGEEREARGPLDGRLPAEESCEDSNLRLVRRPGGERARAREGEDKGIRLIQVRDALLTTVVLRSGRRQSLARLSIRDVVEELADPLGQISLVDTVADNGKVGLAVSSTAESGNSLLIDILGERGVVGEARRVSEAAVEGNRVRGVVGNLGGVVLGSGLSDVRDVVDFLGELVR